MKRRQRVAELYLQGWQQDAIAAELAIRQPMVSDDLAKIRQAWRESAIRDFDAARDLELARLDRIEREACAAWERSKQPSQSATVNGEAGSQTARRTVPRHFRPFQRRSGAIEPGRIAARVRSNRIRDE